MTGEIRNRAIPFSVFLPALSHLSNIDEEGGEEPGSAKAAGMPAMDESPGTRRHHNLYSLVYPN